MVGEDVLDVPCAFSCQVVHHLIGSAHLPFHMSRQPSQQVPDLVAVVAADAPNVRMTAKSRSGSCAPRIVPRPALGMRAEGSHGPAADDLTRITLN
jgi:hypothetical protein